VARLDYLIIGVILLLVLFSWSIINFVILGREAGSLATVSVAGQVVREVDLSESTQFTIQGQPGEGQIAIADGQIRMVAADCPDQICVYTGWISRPGQVIVCVPNRILIQVSGENTDFDAITR
jgi:hypothetical protein